MIPGIWAWPIAWMVVLFLVWGGREGQDLVSVGCFSLLSYLQGLDEYLSRCSVTMCWIIEKAIVWSGSSWEANWPYSRSCHLWLNGTLNRSIYICEILFKRGKGKQFQLVVICRVATSHSSAQGQQKLISLAEEQIPSVLLLVLPVGGLGRIPLSSGNLDPRVEGSLLFTTGSIFWGLFLQAWADLKLRKVMKVPTGLGLCSAQWGFRMRFSLLLQLPRVPLFPTTDFCCWITLRKNHQNLCTLEILLQGEGPPFYLPAVPYCFQTARLWRKHPFG